MMILMDFNNGFYNFTIEETKQYLKSPVFQFFTWNIQLIQNVFFLNYSLIFLTEAKKKLLTKKIENILDDSLYF
jgi:hypothetical protein